MYGDGVGWGGRELCRLVFGENRTKSVWLGFPFRQVTRSLFAHDPNDIAL